MNKCECKNKTLLKEKLKELEQRYEQSKAASAYLQGQVILIKELLECSCDGECDCKK